MTRVQGATITLVLAVAVFILLGCTYLVREEVVEQQDPSWSWQLRADEALDLVRFHGWRVPGGTAYIASAQQALLTEMDWPAARDFLSQAGPTGGLASAVPEPQDPVFLVIVRGRVADGRGGDAQDISNSLAVLLDRRARAHYVGVGSPWDAVAPPDARRVELPAAPRLRSVSHARARIELGHLVLPLSGLPGRGLGHGEITINPAGSAIDPTGATLDETSVTVRYDDASGVGRLWLSQALTFGGAHLSGTEEDVTIGHPLGSWPTTGRRFTTMRDGREVVGIAWQQGDRSFVLSGEIGDGLTEQGIIGLAARTGADLYQSGHELASSPIEVADAWTELRARPLQLPALEPGRACPRSAGLMLPTGYGPALGSGPLYVVGPYDERGETGLFRASGPAPAIDGWSYQGVFVIADPAYRGPALIRGRQLDGPDELRFNPYLPGAEIRFPEGATGMSMAGPEPGWRYYFHAVGVRAPGCYAYQVDGLGFTQVIIFEAD